MKVNEFLNEVCNDLERNGAIALGKALADVASGRLLSVHDDSDGYHFEIEVGIDKEQYNILAIELSNGWSVEIAVQHWLSL
jgi:hypothetical protein